jgi:ABC-type uncharacterized transport system substrate-binding protein
LASDLVGRRPTVIVAAGSMAAGWQRHGVTSLNVEVNPKRLELLHELIPNVKTVGLLVKTAR